MVKPSNGAFGLTDGDAHLADGDLAARGPSTRQRNDPLLDRDVALHPEAEAIAAADFVDRHRAFRFGHRAGEPTPFHLFYVPAPLVRRLTLILDSLDQVQGAVGLDFAAANAA